MSPQRAAAVQFSNSFTFAASGDFGAPTSSDSLASLQSLAASNPTFFLGLGDFSSSDLFPGSAWCSQFKSSFNNIEIVAGDRDTGGHNDTIFQESNNYDQYLDGCPHSLMSPITCGPVAGQCYGKEYYFDYPNTNPLARLIFVSPKIYNITGVCTAYQAGTQCSSQTGQPCADQFGCWQYYTNDIHYNWAAQAIDGARAAGIKWVIVAMHKNCISAGVNTCSMGIEFFNMLISKKVDLILQAHEESYQRSKQIALTGSCTNISTNGEGWATYNPTCILNDGSSGRYPPGKGTVVMIQGDWGRGWDPVNSTSSNGPNAAEAPYFATLMGQNTPGRGHGFVTYKVSPDRIDVQTNFAGAYQDNFSISNSPYKIHDNISIENDSDFTLANGVVQGNGSSSSPYIIQGWEIETGTNGVDVRNTLAHFVIRNTFVLGLAGGIFLHNVSNAVVQDNALSYDLDGITASNSSFTIVENNTILGSQEGIIFDDNSTSDQCNNNRLSGISMLGISVSQFSVNIDLTGNILTSESSAVVAVNATGTVIAKNLISYNGPGIQLEDTDNTTITENIIANNLYAIQVSQSQSIKIFHNNFISNTQSPSVEIIPPSSTASFDNGYPSGGNFWSDYAGSDDCSGPSQDICSDPDGIGDTPYVINGLTQDKYPLTSPYGPEPSVGPSWPNSSSLTATNFDRSSLTLSWTPAFDVHGVNSYQVYNSNSLVAELSGSMLRVTGLALGAMYTFSVQAVDAWSNATLDGPRLTVRMLASGGYVEVGSLRLSPALQGGKSHLDANVTNLGLDDARITTFTASGDIGRFSVQGPTVVRSGSNKSFGLDVLIPLGAYPGNHNVTLSIDWQYYEPQTESWVTANPITTQAVLLVKGSSLPQFHASGQNNLLSYLIVTLAVAAVVSISGVYVISRRNRSRRRSW